MFIGRKTICGEVYTGCSGPLDICVNGNVVNTIGEIDQTICGFLNNFVLWHEVKQSRRNKQNARSQDTSVFGIISFLMELAGSKTLVSRLLSVFDWDIFPRRRVELEIYNIFAAKYSRIFHRPTSWLSRSLFQVLSHLKEKSCTGF